MAGSPGRWRWDWRCTGRVRCGETVYTASGPTILEGLSRRAGVNSGNPHNPAKCRWTGGGKSLCGFRNRCWNGGAWPSVTREVPGRGARMGQRRGCKNLLTRKEAASRVPGGRCELLTAKPKRREWVRWHAEIMGQVPAGRGKGGPGTSAPTFPPSPPDRISALRSRLQQRALPGLEEEAAALW